MDGRRDFTLDPVNFGDLPQLVDQVKSDGLRFIIILDPAIAIDYSTYTNGKAGDVFIKWGNDTTIPDGQPEDNMLIGNVG
jgi:alpha-glucosidase (family GH31 glycosyl hydrolase)